MKIWIVCSKSFYDRIPPIRGELEAAGFEVILPNSYDNPSSEKAAWDAGAAEHVKFKWKMFELSEKIAKSADVMLVLNYEKHGVKNYIGGATFLEMYEAFRNRKPIFLMNDVPEGILYDEICGFAPVVLDGNLDKMIKEIKEGK
jgi:hypothetical protein